MSTETHQIRLPPSAESTTEAPPRDRESDHKYSADEVRGVLETIASTGKFWNDWCELKNMLFFQLKQVLLEYPELTMSYDQQKSSLGETYAELEKRLHEALLSFTEGPPFTLQRLCEILLNARAIYPNLSKLALALEKNLLVTTTLTMSMDACPPSTEQQPDTSEEGFEQALPHSNSVENGEERMTGDQDEVMAQVEEAEIEDMAMGMEAFEESSCVRHESEIN